MKSVSEGVIPVTGCVSLGPKIVGRDPDENRFADQRMFFVAMTVWIGSGHLVLSHRYTCLVTLGDPRESSCFWTATCLLLTIRLVSWCPPGDERRE